MELSLTNARIDFFNTLILFAIDQSIFVEFFSTYLLPPIHCAESGEILFFSAHCVGV